MGATVLEHRWGAVSITITPTAVTSFTSSAQSFTVGGLTTQMQILRVSPPSFNAGAGVTGLCQSNGNITLMFSNITGSPITPAPGSYVVNWFRPDGGPRTTVTGT